MLIYFIDNAYIFNKCNKILYFMIFYVVQIFSTILVVKGKN